MAVAQWAGYLADILITATPSVSMTNEAYTDSGDHTTYTITNAAHRYLDRTAAFVVQTSPDGSTWTTAGASTYTIRYVGGQIIFNSANANGTQVRISSGKYFAYASMGFATDATFQGKITMYDGTSLQGASGTGVKSFVPGILEGTITCKKFWVDNTMVNHLLARDLLVVSVVGPNGTNRYEGYCYTADSNVSIAVNALDTTALTFQLTDQFFAV